MNRKGFTLIELLVVIAIIGLLSSLAVVSLSSARNKAYDAGIKSDLSQFRTYAAVNYETGNYGGTTPLAFANVTPPIAPPTCANMTGDDYVVVLSTDTGVTFYAAYSNLCTDNTKWFCVDSSGNAKEEPSTAAKPTAGATVVCP
ncbi:MAG: prepilin-type N-terminal cleavage/methylation domain-containing protein [Patescibacteria group bacterium]